MEEAIKILEQIRDKATSEYSREVLERAIMRLREALSAEVDAMYAEFLMAHPWEIENDDN